jgi:antibiotic biosynthesis monooxygenase (ABM) superfamily enzyme
MTSARTSVQLRRYEIKPGAMEQFLEAVRAAFPVREQYGFTVEFALIDEERNQFTWAVSHDGDFAAAEAAYYESPERAALPANPADFIDTMHLGMVKVERL